MQRLLRCYDITVNATGNIALTDSSLIANNVGTKDDANNQIISIGQAGNINLNANSLSLETGSQNSIKPTKISTESFSMGNAGNITINVQEDLLLDNGIINAQIQTGGLGNSGEISLKAQSIELQNGSFTTSSTYGQGNASDTTINVQKALLLDNSAIYADSGYGARGNVGDISLTANSLGLQNGSYIASSSFGQGKAGNITINVQDALTLDSSYIIAHSGFVARGNGGDISLTANSLGLQNSSYITASLFGQQGNAGNITINVQDALTLNSGSYIGSTIFYGVVGNSGDISLTANSLELKNGASLSTNTSGQGKAGNIAINVQDALTLDGSGIFADSTFGAVGNGGDISLTANSLELKNGAFLSTNTYAQGKAGNITINVQDALTLDGSSILSQIQSGGDGTGGEITLQANNLSVSGGGQISSSTYGQGNAGNVLVKVAGAVNVSGFGTSINYPSAIFSDVTPGGVGSAGDVTITANNFSVSGGGQISSSTYGQGNAGNVTINANTAQLTEGGEINSLTATGSLAGKITLNITNNLTIDGLNPAYNPSNVDAISPASGIFASTISGSTGNGGNISINTPTTVIQNGGEIGVNSSGSGEGGNITLTGGNLTLDQGLISAQTASNTGGNIKLNLGGTLLLQNNSNITATAGTALAGGNGGNIDINAQFIIAFPQENSNITANAYTGNGGNISITTQGLFGLSFQNEPTPFSEITASSQFGTQGLVNVNLLRNEELETVETLPNTPIDVSEVLEQRCLGSTIASNEKESKFIQTGRGGLPSNPNNAIASEAILSPPWVIVDSSSVSTTQGPEPARDQTTPTPTKKIVEATGWRRNANGDIELIAVGTTINPEPVSNSCGGVR